MTAVERYDSAVIWMCLLSSYAETQSPMLQNWEVGPLGVDQVMKLELSWVGWAPDVPESCFIPSTMWRHNKQVLSRNQEMGPCWTLNLSIPYLRKANGIRSRSKVSRLEIQEEIMFLKNSKWIKKLMLVKGFQTGRILLPSEGSAFCSMLIFN
jgi:hypothetical protein